MSSGHGSDFGDRGSGHDKLDHEDRIPARLRADGRTDGDPPTQEGPAASRQRRTRTSRQALVAPGRSPERARDDSRADEQVKGDESGPKSHIAEVVALVPIVVVLMGVLFAYGVCAFVVVLLVTTALVAGRLAYLYYKNLIHVTAGRRHRIVRNPYLVAGFAVFVGLVALLVWLNANCYCSSETNGRVHPQVVVNMSESLVNPEGDALEEYLCVSNVGADPVNLLGWRLSDEVGATFEFPFFILEPQQSVRVNTGAGENTSSDLYWNRGRAVWRDTGDTAYLRDADGELVDRKSYATRQPGAVQGPCSHVASRPAVTETSSC
jgi:hypothetical protein